jgi:hypothetical protein
MSLAIDAGLHLFAVIYHSLKYFKIHAGLLVGARAAEVTHLVVFSQQHARALLADALENRHCVLEVAHVKYG